MTDLSYCYCHMSDLTLNGLDDLERDWIEGSLKPDSKYSSLAITTVSQAEKAIDVPSHQIPPDPNDSDTLPSQVHPSYPYGNPTKPSHPVAFEPLGRGSSRAYYDDMRFERLRRLDRLRWTNLALDLLLPIDHEKEEAMKAAAARRAAKGEEDGDQEEDDGEEGEGEGEDEGTEEVEGSNEGSEYVE
ncbi:unnamed protein product [Rhizoctonia solani]|uniref:Uncharacterized protein n=1 Tax=Rhizoctonia solani TaxID=456999 RepID=A0A8H3B3K5_9AGAM|nr:unnamed protein product [Rhizoctonia solani]